MPYCISGPEVMQWDDRIGDIRDQCGHTVRANHVIALWARPALVTGFVGIFEAAACPVEAAGSLAI